jgi:hypothetical protein
MRNPKPNKIPVKSVQATVEVTTLRKKKRKR